MTILQVRKILGKKYDKYSDEELTVLLNQLYGLAEIVLAQAISLSGSNKQLKVIDCKKGNKDNE